MLQLELGEAKRTAEGGQGRQRCCVRARGSAGGAAGICPGRVSSRADPPALQGEYCRIQPAGHSWQTADQAFPLRSLRCMPVLQGHLPLQEQRWSMTGLEPLARTHGSHGSRHRSSPGELAPAQHAISADLCRPASLSLADIGVTGLVQPGSGRARTADSALGSLDRRGGRVRLVNIAGCVRAVSHQ